MAEERSQASREEVSEAIEQIRAYHEEGKTSLKELPERGAYAGKAIEEQAERLGWNPTKLRKARQFAHPEEGYNQEQLKKLFRLLREHWPTFGISYIGLLVTVPWPDREQLQRECIEKNWSKSELQAEMKKRYGCRRHGGRRRRVSSDPGHALVQIAEMADTWHRWFKIAKEEKILDALPEEVKTQVRAVERVMSSLSEAVTAALDASRK